MKRVHTTLPKKRLEWAVVRLYAGLRPDQMDGYDSSVALEDRRLRKQLNQAWNDLDEMRMRLEYQVNLVFQMNERIKELEKLETVSRALEIAERMLYAQQEQIEREIRSPSPEPVPLARELSVAVGQGLDT